MPAAEVDGGAASATSLSDGAGFPELSLTVGHGIFIVIAVESSDPVRRGRPRSFDRERALRAALRVFREHGYEGTSMSHLQEALGGLSPPSIYAAFGSKEQLFKEATELYVATRKSAAERDMAGAVTARDAIGAMLRCAVMGSTESGEPRGCLLVQGAITCSASSEGVQEYLHGFRVEEQRSILKRLRAGVPSGELPAGANVQAMAQFYTTFVRGIAIQARDGATRASLMDAVDCAMAAWDSLVRQ
jgi:AcrR family transcriptional regulator